MKLGYYDAKYIGAQLNEKAQVVDATIMDLI